MQDERTDVNKPMNENATPSYVACYNGNIEVVKHMAQDQRVNVNNKIMKTQHPSG